MYVCNVSDPRYNYCPILRFRLGRGSQQCQGAYMYSIGRSFLKVYMLGPCSVSMCIFCSPRRVLLVLIPTGTRYVVSSSILRVGSRLSSVRLNPHKGDQDIIHVTVNGELHTALKLQAQEHPAPAAPPRVVIRMTDITTPGKPSTESAAEFSRGFKLSILPLLLQ